MQQPGTTGPSPHATPAEMGPATDGKAEDQLPAPAAVGLAATFRSLRHRNYRLYFFGQLISLVGTWMQTTALTWLAYDITHQSKWTAWVAVAQILPTFLFGAWGGTLADRWPKRSLIFVTQSAFMVLAFLLSGLTLGGVVAPWQLVVVSAAAGLVQAIDLPARLAFVVDMAGREDLMNAVALNSLLFNVARALGPAMAGLLLWVLSPWSCFLANGFSYVAVLWALACMDISGAPKKATLSIDSGDRSLFSGFRALHSGFSYLARHKDLAFLVLLAGTTAFSAWPFLSLLPALAKNVLGSQEKGYSWMLSGTGLGALAAAWSLATFGTMQRGRGFIGTGVLLVSLGLMGLASVHNLYLAIAFCALIGFGLIQFLATSQSIVQLRTGDHNRGVIMGIWAMVLSGAVPLGNLLAGPAADRWGEPLALWVEGVSCGGAALGLLAVFGRSLHRGPDAFTPPPS